MYRAATLRWHPDKFTAKHGPRLAPADRDRILERVGAISQSINEEFKRLYGS